MKKKQLIVASIIILSLIAFSIAQICLMEIHARPQKLDEKELLAPCIDLDEMVTHGN